MSIIDNHHHFDGTEIPIDELVEEFASKKYCIVKKYFSPEQCDLLLDYSSGFEPSISFGHHYIMDTDMVRSLDFDKYEEVSSFAEKEKEYSSKNGLYPMSELFINISVLRIKLMIRAYEKGAFPRRAFDGMFLYKKNNQINNIGEYLLEDYWRKDFWGRFMSYMKEDDVLNPHKDAYGEIMAILFLTSPNTDYSGGLSIFEEQTKSEKCIDDLCEQGDLLILDGNAYLHWVDNIKNISGKGRKTFFVNGILKHEYDSYLGIERYSGNSNNIEDIKREMIDEYCKK